MFQFSGSTFIKLCIHSMITSFALVGFPHSEICGSKPICGYPQLIAACHVLLRLLMPRHSPYALYSLTFDPFSNYVHHFLCVYNFSMMIAKQIGQYPNRFLSDFSISASSICSQICQYSLRYFLSLSEKIQTTNPLDLIA